MIFPVLVLVNEYGQGVLGTLVPEISGIQDHICAPRLVDAQVKRHLARRIRSARDAVLSIDQSLVDGFVVEAGKAVLPVFGIREWYG